MCGFCCVMVNDKCTFHTKKKKSIKKDKSTRRKNPPTKLFTEVLSKHYETMDEIIEEIHQMKYIPKVIANIIIDYVDSREICIGCNKKYNYINWHTCFKCDKDLCEHCGIQVNTSCNICYCCKNCYKIKEECAKCSIDLCCFYSCDKCNVCKKVYCSECTEEQLDVYKYCTKCSPFKKYDTEYYE